MNKKIFFLHYIPEKTFLDQAMPPVKMLIITLFVFFFIFVIYYFIKYNYKNSFNENLTIIYNKDKKNNNNKVQEIIDYSNNDKLLFSIKKIAIITSIYGEYDVLKEQNINNKNIVDWYCFTDSKNLKSKGWNINNIPYHMNEFNEYYSNLKKDNLKHYNMMSAKYYKINSHKVDILQKYDYYIWIDGSIFLQKDFIKNIYKVINKTNKEVIHFKHSARDNIKDEYLFSKDMMKYKMINLYKQYNDYIKYGFTDNKGLYENTIIIRKNVKKINNAFEKWFQENIKYGFQDQISLPYIYWKYNINPYLINENVFNNKLYSYVNLSLNINH